MNPNAASRRRPVSLADGSLVPAWDRKLERQARRRPPSVPSPEELGTMLASGGQPGEDARLDARLVAAAMDRPYQALVVIRVRCLRAAAYTPRRDGFVWSVGFMAGLWLVRMLLAL